MKVHLSNVEETLLIPLWGLDVLTVPQKQFLLSPEELRSTLRQPCDEDGARRLAMFGRSAGFC
ncbi:MAG TPA: hypothetical protein VEF35_05270 [Candidatus Bathyarchaeia archaeon]|nr:hypothetical protein [Candidatus Bathyarchaeia archaeon]